MLRSQVNPFATRYVQPGMVAWFATDTQSLATLERRFIGELGCRAAIVGPHGTGKSTLLEHLVPKLGRVCYREAAAGPHAAAILRNSGQPASTNDFIQNQLALNPIPQNPIPQNPISINTSRLHSEPSSPPRSIVWLALRRGAEAAQRVVLSRQHWLPGGMLVIDGFEQLGWWTQWRTMHSTRRRGMGLLVTSHRRLALSTLVQTQASVPLVQHVIHRAQENAGVALAPGFASPPLIAQLLQEEGGNVREVLMRLYDRVHEALPR